MKVYMYYYFYQILKLGRIRTTIKQLNFNIQIMVARPGPPIDLLNRSLC